MGTGWVIADLIGVAVFAASGASAGVVKRFDIFGVIFVGTVAALGGGIVRDLLIGAVPPYAFTHWLYMAVAVVASALVFWLHPQYGRLRRQVLVLDAAGLGLFCATATLRARDAGVPVLGACIIGMITGIGGGLGRDLLTGEIPIVLRREIYAVAALFGAVLVLALVQLHLNRPAAVTITAASVFAIRLIALRRKWSAPTPREPRGWPAPAVPRSPAPGSTSAQVGWPIEHPTAPGPLDWRVENPTAAPASPDWRVENPTAAPGGAIGLGGMTGS